jgi:hypothetical protein
MQLPPMSAPAEIHRRIEGNIESGWKSSEVIIARGPLVIMAHGLCAIRPELRRGCWIRSDVGDLSADEAEKVLRSWEKPAEGAHDES